MAVCGRTVVLAAGDFPRKGGTAWNILAGAARVVACDGAACEYRRRFRKEPDVITGDLDSLHGRFKKAEIVKVDDQDTNDLDKALSLCEARGWKNPVVAGATGKRDDHSIGNIFRAYDRLVETATDSGRFFPVSGRRTFRVRKGAAVSVFAKDPATKAKSAGLVWPLDGVRFENAYCATLNRASSSIVSVSADRPVYVFIADEIDTCKR